MAERLQRVRFENRKASILKQGRELSTLCGVKLCLMIVSPDGKVETWPQNRDDVKAILGAANAAPSVKKVAALSDSTSSDDQPAVKDNNPRKRRKDPLRQIDVPNKMTKTAMATTADSTNYNVVGSDPWNNVINGFGSIPMFDTWNLEDGSFTAGLNGYFEKNLFQDPGEYCGHDLQFEEDPSVFFTDCGKDLELQQLQNQFWAGDAFGGNGLNSGATMASPPPPQGFSGCMFEPLPALQRCGSIELENTLLRDFC
ncbi:unnamed protein product [Cuscuta epithymum]|uniref:MADS-box domain-containing protein n=1 Tax=Cuscuta epithymum TaxID=186058 RepID=A0AAV0FLN9_9ASTE|nr:unnamed protein product [Cuscuta epithymum]